jgi:hypothetical protein
VAPRHRFHNQHPTKELRRSSGSQARCLSHISLVPHLAWDRSNHHISQCLAGLGKQKSSSYESIPGAATDSLLKLAQYLFQYLMAILERMTPYSLLTSSRRADGDSFVTVDQILQDHHLVKDSPCSIFNFRIHEGIKIKKAMLIPIPMVAKQ